jgi:signal transduction histidine kinase/ActR/RegA family two-component response regulator
MSLFEYIRRSIRTKLLVAVIGTTFAALMVAAAALLFYDLRTYERSSIDELTTLAEVVGRASAPALVFDDRQAAIDNLRMLRAQPRILSGAIYDARGVLFARYGEDAPMLAAPQADGYLTEGDRISVVRNVDEKGERVGSVHVAGRFDIRSRLMNYAAILAIVMASSLGVAVALSMWARRTFTEPIAELARVARGVIERRDFSQRVEKSTDDELGLLVHGFNAMLAEVGGRSEALEHEVAERRAAENALREEHRRKDEFIAVLSHELRNPLSPIRNAVAFLRSIPLADSNVAWARDVIDRQSGQLVRLIEDLMDVSRISRNRLELRLAVVPLAQAVDMAVESTRAMFAANHQTLEVSLPQQPLYVRADIARLAQVLGNLLNNAAKYTNRGGSIVLDARRSGPEVVVRVIDDGIGIPAEQLDHVFEMFSQVELNRSRSLGGLGIGLALVKALVEMHRGTVSAQSEGAGQGTTFTVRLPLAANVAGTLPAARASRPGAALAILVADDVADSLESLCALLRGAGHEVFAASDGNEALSIAGERRPEVAILDIGMPGMSGYDVAQAIRRERWGADMKLIALTGWGQKDDVRRSMEAGFDHHMTKPAEPTRLYELLYAAAQPRSADVKDGSAAGA